MQVCQPRVSHSKSYPETRLNLCTTEPSSLSFEMATRGQRFELDLNADNWKFDVKENNDVASPLDVIKDIKERDASDVPAAPTLKTSKTGFPEHRPRKTLSTFKQQQMQQAAKPKAQHPGPSDKAILHHVAKKQGVDLEDARQKADIDSENRNRLNEMTLEEIEEARAELMAQINPDALRKFLQRANVDNDNQQQQKDWDDHEAGRPRDPSKKTVAFAEPQEAQAEDEWLGKMNVPPITEATQSPQPQTEHIPPPPSQQSSIHFPKPPRNKADYKPLNPSSPSFLRDLREHYFPDLPHDPNALSWLQDPSETDEKDSSYNPDRVGFAPSALRFNFNGMLIPPSESLNIPTTKGLHHHGDAPNSAGYTVPELTLLARSQLPNQRCVAHQIMGRILYRLGRGDFGPRGGEMQEGLWMCIERERIVEIMMSEANRDKGHLSAKSFATEALWLWRRGGGGDRGVLKEGERRAT